MCKNKAFVEFLNNKGTLVGRRAIEAILRINDVGKKVIEVLFLFL